jgi:hypothetical protein
MVFDGHLFFLFAEWPTVATLPSALFNERLSLGASWVFSFQPLTTEREFAESDPR